MPRVSMFCKKKKKKEFYPQSCFYFHSYKVHNTMPKV